MTDNPAIDTSPSYAPDGNLISFNSDRGGTAQLYVMDKNGANIRRISYGQGRYYTPVWSPRGDYVAFTRQAGGNFYIGLMRPDGSLERMLVESSGVIESPTWAPNGRYLLFYEQQAAESETRAGATRLFMIDVTGRNRREIVTPVGASDPAWSPLID